MFDGERISDIVLQIDEFAKTLRTTFATDTEKVLQATGRLHESWSGSSLGHHAEIYFQNFERPPHRFNSEWGTQNGMPPGWSYRTAEDVSNEIFRRCGIDLKELNSNWDRELQKLSDLRDDLDVELSHLDESERTQCEAILRDVSTFEFNDSVRKKIAASNLNAFRARVSRDLRAISAGGVVMPSQIYYDALANEILSTLGRADDLVKLGKRVLRCMELTERQRTIPITQGALEKMRHMMKDPFSLVKKNGQTLSFKGILTEGKLITFDSSIPFEDNDIVERILPGNRTERYLILDTGFHSRFGAIDDHYQMKVRKGGEPENADAVRNVTNIYNVSGHSARVNLHAVDSSSNVVQIGELELFEKIRLAVESGVADVAQRQQLLERLGELEVAKGTPQFGERFQSLIAVASNCMTVLAPFLPALTTLITS